MSLASNNVHVKTSFFRYVFIVKEYFNCLYFIFSRVLSPTKDQKRDFQWPINVFQRFGDPMLKSRFCLLIYNLMRKKYRFSFM